MRLTTILLAGAALAAFPTIAAAQNDAERRMLEVQQQARDFELQRRIQEVERRVENMELQQRSDDNLRRLEQRPNTDPPFPLVTNTVPYPYPITRRDPTAEQLMALELAASNARLKALTQSDKK